MKNIKRHHQLAKAQQQFRSKKRGEGCERVQTWLPHDSAQRLRVLCSTLNKSQTDVLILALAQLEREFASNDAD